jgi:hypothetical protein
VNCPQKAAFEYYCERDNDLEWWDGVVESRRTSEIARGVGETVRQTCTVSGIPYRFDIDLEVVEWQEPERYREVNRSGATPYDCWYIVEKIDEDRSRVKLEGEVWFSGLAFLLSPLAKVLLDRQSERNFDTLKRRLDDLGARIQVTGS